MRIVNTVSLWLLSLAAHAAELPPMALSLVFDSDASPGTASSRPGAFRTIDGVVYFTATTPAHGTELYRTDGTPAGLRLVQDFAPGTASSGAVALGGAGGRVIVSGGDGMSGRRLWAVDAGGAVVRLTNGGPNGSMRVLGAPGGRLVLQHDEDRRLWTTDGTPAGTFDLGVVPASTFGAGAPCMSNGAVVFQSDVLGAPSLTRSDGTRNGTYSLGAVAGLPDGRVQATEAANGRCYLLYLGNGTNGYNGWTLVETDATVAGTRTLATEASAAPLGLASLGGVLYVAQREASRVRLRRHDPGSGSFVTVVDFPGAYNNEFSFARIGSLLGITAPYAIGSDYRPGYYVSDGTAAGTRRVYPAQPEPQTYWSGLTVPAPGGRFLFDWRGLVRVDGTTGQATAAPALDESFYRDGVVAGGAFFGPSLGEAGVEVWRTDGTPAGTGPLHDVWTSTADGVASYPPVAYVAGDVVYTTTSTRLASDFPGDYENTVLRSDGTVAGTRTLPAGAHAPGLVDAIVPFGDGIAFRVNKRSWVETTMTWYRADAALTVADALSIPLARSSRPVEAGPGFVFGCGTPQSAVDDLCRITPSDPHAGVLRANVADATWLRPIGSVGNVGVFAVGGAVWRSDGTLPGTFPLVAASPEGRPLDVGGSAMLRGKLHFGIHRYDGPSTLVATDGTVAGTSTVAELAAGSIVQQVVSIGDRLVVGAVASVIGADYVHVWGSDGTTAGTQPLLVVQFRGSWTLTAVGSKAHLQTGCFNGCEKTYYVTDATPAGTRRIVLPGAIEAGLSVVAAVGDAALVFACSKPSTGAELCVVDRDGEHVRFLADVHPGPNGSSPVLLARTSNDVYLTLDDGTHGYELWRLRALPDLLFASGFDR